MSEVGTVFNDFMGIETYFEEEEINSSWNGRNVKQDKKMASCLTFKLPFLLKLPDSNRKNFLLKDIQLVKYEKKPPGENGPTKTTEKTPGKIVAGFVLIATGALISVIPHPAAKAVGGGRLQLELLWQEWKLQMSTTENQKKKRKKKNSHENTIICVS